MWLDLLREVLLLVLQVCKYLPFVERRWALRERLNCSVKGSGVLWMHGASMGECGVLLQVSRDLEFHSILITTQKVEVRNWLRERIPSHVQVALAPLDHSGVVHRFLAQTRPVALILCENEIWPSWVLACALQGVPVALVSGVMSSVAFARWMRWAPAELQLVLRHIHPLWVQDAVSAERLRVCGKPDARIGGDWKWLSVPSDPELLQIDTSAEWEARPVDLALVSIHREDWPSLSAGLATFAEFGGAAVLIPRWPQDAAFFARSLRRAKVRVCAWPLVQRGAVSLVSQFGCVRQVLGQSRLALIGGSFCPVGVHNYRESLSCGVPVLVGPNRGALQEELGFLEKAGVVRSLGNLEEMCIGRHGRDCWISTWFPWEKRYLIPDAVRVCKSMAEESYGEFLHWVRQLRIFAS